MKVNIIGAGISGLSAGIYLQKCGFQTEIFEKHSIPGGLCTSWKKGDYIFDSCAHWILGSDRGSSFYLIWSELMDMGKIKFHNHDVRVEIGLKNNKDKYGNTYFKLYTNLDKLEAYMIDLAPEDTKAIRRFIKPMRIMQKFDLPPILDDLPFFKSLWRGIKMMRYVEFLLWFMKLRNHTNFTYAQRFKNPFLKESFELMYDGDEVNMLVLTLPLSVFDKKSAGYPIGGSMAYAKKVEESYIASGGKVRYNTIVKKIICEDDKATGLLVRNDVIHKADIIISAADWNFTVFQALDGKYMNKNSMDLKNLNLNEVFFSVMQFSFGINKDLSDYPHFFRFPLEKDLLSPDGTVYKRFEIHIYNYDPTVAPKGKTSVTVSFYTKNSDFWIDARKSDRPKYRAAKESFKTDILAILDKELGGISDLIEEIDIATPATFQRYTNNWKGSTQGWLPTKNILGKPPVGFQLDGLSNFYYSSHWNHPGGGLPIAIKTGRDVAKLICKKTGVPFKSN